MRTIAKDRIRVILMKDTIGSTTSYVSSFVISSVTRYGKSVKTNKVAAKI